MDAFRQARDFLEANPQFVIAEESNQGAFYNAPESIYSQVINTADKSQLHHFLSEPLTIQAPDHVQFDDNHWHPSEITPVSRVLHNIEHYQFSSNILGLPPEPISSTSVINTPDETQVRDESRQSMDVVSVIKIGGESQLSHKYLQPSKLSSKPAITTPAGEMIQFVDEEPQSCELLSTLPAFEATGRQQSAEHFLPPSELSSISPFVNTLDNGQSSYNSQQPLELISTESLSETAQPPQFDNVPRSISREPIPSSLEIDPHETEYSSDCRQPPDHSLEVYPQSSNIIDDNFHQPQPLKPLSNLPLLQHTNNFQSNGFSLHASVETNPAPSGIKPPYNSYEMELSNDRRHHPVPLVSKVAVLDTVEQFPPSNDPLVYPPELIPRSPDITNTDFVEFSDNYLQNSSEIWATQLDLLTTHGAKLSNEYQGHSTIFMSIPPPPEAFLTSVILEARSESSEEEPEITPLQYARDNGLSRNYLQTPYSNTNLKVLVDYQQGLTDDSHLSQFDLSTTVNTDERLTVSKEAAILIASVSREEPSEWVDDLVLGIVTRKYKIPRLELPLLRSDHETDCKKFAQREGFEIKLQDVKLPLEVVDYENGGLGFLPSLWNKGVEVLEGLKMERLEVSKDTLVYLQTTLRGDWTEEDEKKVWASSRTYKRRKALEPVTPPLSPILPPVQLYEPSMSDPIFELPMLSGPESLTRRDLEAIEDQAFKEDIPTPIRNARDRYGTSSDTLVSSDTVKLADIYSPAASLDKPPISPTHETKRVKREDLKIEELLTPTQSAEPPKTVGFSTTILEWPGTTGSPITDPLESSYFKEAFGDAYEKATRMAEQEALVTADTMARVDVPKLDFSIPAPPWKIVQAKEASRLDMQKTVMKNCVRETFPKWHRIGKIEVRYNPFPHELARVALEENFDGDDSTWQSFVKGLGDDEVIDTSALTWKPPGLKVLKDEDDNEEIEPSQYDNDVPRDLSYLVKKRKMEIEDRDIGEDLVMQGAHFDAAATKRLPRKKTPKPTEFLSTARKSPLGTTGGKGYLLMGGAFSVGSLVENFLEIRGTKKPKLGGSSHFAKSGAAKIAATLAKPAPQPELLLQPSIRNSPVPKTNTPLPAPSNNIPNTPVNVIVTLTLLKHRALIKHIEALFPRIVLVERDFSAHDTTVWMPGSVTRSPIASPLASEADIIVSPLVGIIITTLQKIKQKPLPGQKTKPAIRERLEKVSLRYDKLIVLVTEKKDDEATRELDESDCNALNELVGFALSLETPISIQFVGGGEATLATWLVDAVVRHGSDEELLTDETHWEIFLRRAGLNAFAAQHIIAVLKAPDNIDLSSPSKAGHYGLTAFVEMGREQRIARFGPVCGDRMMRRVSAVVDARWS